MKVYFDYNLLPDKVGLMAECVQSYNKNKGKLVAQFNLGSNKTGEADCSFSFENNVTVFELGMLIGQAIEKERQAVAKGFSNE